MDRSAQNNITPTKDVGKKDDAEIAQAPTPQKRRLETKPKSSPVVKRAMPSSKASPIEVIDVSSDEDEAKDAAAGRTSHHEAALTTEEGKDKSDKSESIIELSDEDEIKLPGENSHQSNAVGYGESSQEGVEAYAPIHDTLGSQLVQNQSSNQYSSYMNGPVAGIKVKQEWDTMVVPKMEVDDDHLGQVKIEPGDHQFAQEKSAFELFDEMMAKHQLMSEYGEEGVTKESGQHTTIKQEPVWEDGQPSSSTPFVNNPYSSLQSTLASVGQVEIEPGQLGFNKEKTTAQLVREMLSKHQLMSEYDGEGVMKESGQHTTIKQEPVWEDGQPSSSTPLIPYSSLQHTLGSLGQVKVEPSHDEFFNPLNPSPDHQKPGAQLFRDLMTKSQPMSKYDGEDVMNESGENANIKQEPYWDDIPTSSSGPSTSVELKTPKQEPDF